MEAALAEVKDEHGQYFEAIEKVPYLLVGQKVPAIGREGDQIIRDVEDAKGWQDAVRSLLVAEVKGKAAEAMDADGSTQLQTVHASIKMFQDNADLVPKTKTFDADLANRVTSTAKPYEIRNEAGKLLGYSIPLQGIIDQTREALKVERAAAATAAAPAAAATAAAPAAGQAATGAAAPAGEPPQAGITSKAGSSTESEDYSTLFGTLGLSNFTI